jgi:hypothetical protein
MGDGRIFLKTRRDASLNKDLSNEPNFDRIHLVDIAFKSHKMTMNLGSGLLPIYR